MLLAPHLLAVRGPAFFSILFLRLLGQKWNLVKKVLKVACDADVAGRGHHRVASQVLAAPLDLTCAKCLWGFQVHRHYRVNLTIAHLRIALLGGNPEVGNSEYINHQNCPPQLT